MHIDRHVSSGTSIILLFHTAVITGMGQYRTEQERIDAITLEIKVRHAVSVPSVPVMFCSFLGIESLLLLLQNPNVVGSGYIQHPPQRPFSQPLQLQPPTVAVRCFPLFRQLSRCGAKSFRYDCFLVPVSDLWSYVVVCSTTNFQTSMLHTLLLWAVEEAAIPKLSLAGMTMDITSQDLR
jgi:hypothetical protein